MVRFNIVRFTQHPSEKLRLEAVKWLGLWLLVTVLWVVDLVQNASSERMKDGLTTASTVNVSYRPGDKHKPIAHADAVQRQHELGVSEDAQVPANCDTFQWLQVGDEMLDRLSDERAVQLGDAFNLVRLRNGSFDTTQGAPGVVEALRQQVVVGPRLHLIQGVSPMKQEWQGQVIAGHMNVVETTPVRFRLAGLASRSFDLDGCNCVVDVVDMEWDRGWTVSPNLHRNFPRAGDGSRVAFRRKVAGAWSSVSVSKDVGEQGTLATLIIGRFNDFPGPPSVDAVARNSRLMWGRVIPPGRAKNVIGAGRAQEVGKDSNSGPTTPGRVKPDLVVPTPIRGVDSQDVGFTGTGVCGTPSFPEGQAMYTWSSSTNPAAAAVAGSAACVRQWFLDRPDPPHNGQPPSAAMTQALFVNLVRRLMGFSSAGLSPSNSQGWGDRDLGGALDESPRLLFDRERVESVILPAGSSASVTSLFSPTEGQRARLSGTHTTEQGMLCLKDIGPNWAEGDLIFLRIYLTHN